VALTGVDVTALPPSFREGVDLFIQKPFRVSQLIEGLHKLVGNETPSDAAPSPQP
jgi:FixJ family two-component response regulator